jgi:hypothetical protein
MNWLTSTWLHAAVAGIVTGGTIGAIIGFVFREIFKGIVQKSLETYKDVLSTRLERMKSELKIGESRRQLTLQSEIQFKERQLAEFYGPIYGLLKRIRAIDDLWEDDKLNEIDSSVREIIQECNSGIVKIILEKSHLIQGDKIPDSHTHFLLHVAVWHACLDLEARAGGKSVGKAAGGEIYEKHPESHYKVEFEEEIYYTTEQLKRELYHLYEEYGLSPINTDRSLPKSLVDSSSTQGIMPSSH